MASSSAFRILVVEDNPGDVVLLRYALEESAVDGSLHAVRSGEEALALLGGDESFDLVVLDVDLPGRSGLEVLRALKTEGPVETTPVLILSTSDDEDAVREAYELGANAYLVKRQTFEDTVALVKAIDAFWRIVELPK